MLACNFYSRKKELTPQSTRKERNIRNFHLRSLFFSRSGDDLKDFSKPFEVFCLLRSGFPSYSPKFSLELLNISLFFWVYFLRKIRALG